MVYSTRQFVLSFDWCYFVLVFFSPLSIVLTSLGEESANLSAFRMFVWFTLVWFCLFLLPLGVWEGLRLLIVALPGLFSYFFWKDCQKLSTLYWLPKLHKRSYKARFIANLNSCTTELSKFLTSCLTAIRKNVHKYWVKSKKDHVRICFWSFKNSNEDLNKIKSRRFCSSRLSTYDFTCSTLHYLIILYKTNLII